MKPSLLFLALVVFCAALLNARQVLARDGAPYEQFRGQHEAWKRQQDGHLGPTR